MKFRQLTVALSTFSYGGNGGISSEHPDVRKFFLNTVMAASKDPRVEGMPYFDLADTPITMTRNQAIAKARAIKADALLMVDSDMSPDMYLKSLPEAKPFWNVAFDFLYDHWERGPVVIGAPYCMGPPEEIPAVGHWVCDASPDYQASGDVTNPLDAKLRMYSREHAAIMSGIQPCAAIGTGLILYDMRIFDLLAKPYFDYEWIGEDDVCPCCRQHIAGERAAKASTEDIYCTRDIAIGAGKRLGYNPLFCAWDSWSGHWKPKCVGKPQVLTAEHVGRRLAQTLDRDWSRGTRMELAGDVHEEVPADVIAAFDDKKGTRNGALSRSA